MKRLWKYLGFGALAVLALFGRDIVQTARSGVACSVPFVFSNGTTADATQVNANFNALVNCFGTAAAAGANSDITSLSALSTPITPTQGGSNRYLGTGSGTNTISVPAVSPIGFSLTGGYRVSVLVGGTNTGDTTLNVFSTGNIGVRRQLPSGYGKLVGSEIINGGRSEFLYDANNAVWVLLNPFNSGIPGEVKDIAGVGGAGGCPAGWVEANGQLVNSTNFPDINAALGTLWGTSGGNTVMPDLRGTATFSRDQGGSTRLTSVSGFAGGNPSTTVGSFNYTGTGSSAEKITLTQAMLPSATLAFTASNSITGHIATSNGAFTGTLISVSGGTSVPNCNGVCADGGNGYTPTGTVALGGSSTAHTIIGNAAIVTKCVKL